MNTIKNIGIPSSKTADCVKTPTEINADETRWKKHEAIIAASALYVVKRNDLEKPSEGSSVADTAIVAANKNLIFQTLEKDKLASKLLIADREIAFQNKQKEQRLVESCKTDRLYAFTSKVNQLMLHAKGEAALFHNICKTAVEFGEFRMTWVGLFGNANSTITNAEHMTLNCAEMPGHEVHLRADSPQALVLQTGKHYVCNDILNNVELKSWTPMATQRDIASCLILPLERGGVVIGTVNLYSGDVNFFEAVEIEMLLELAANISYTLTAIENKNTHKTRENLLRRNEQLFRKLIENQEDMLILSTVIGKLLYVSPVISELLGYTIEEFEDKSLPDFIHPEDINDFMENRDSIAKKPGQSFSYKHRLLHKNGEWVWCQGIDTNRLNEAGINAIVSNFHEVSKNDSITDDFDNNNLDALINSTDDLMWSVDKDFNLITANQPFNDAVELAFGKSIKKGESTLSPLYPVKQLAQYKAGYNRAFAGESFTDVIYFDLPVESWSEISFCPMTNGTEIIGAACHSRDITAHKQSEQALTRAKSDLIQSESRLKEAQAMAQVGNFEIDLIHQTDVWSDEMYNISGIKKGDIQPSAELFFSFIHPEDASSVKSEFEECVRTLQNRSFEFKFINKDGTIKNGRTEVRFEFDENGSATRLFGIFQDITEQILAGTERTKMVNELTLRNAELEQFGYIISHNLRAPIANIIGATTALSDPGLDNHDKQILNIGITVSALKLDDVVKDLNAILEIKQEIEDTKEIVHFSELTDDVKLNVQESIDEGDIEINYDFSETDELFTLKVYIQNIFHHLISNSIKYCRKHVHSIIEVKSKLFKNKLVLTFKDNGLGINLKKCGDKVFGLYNRFHTHIKGKGMGLFMVKAQVEALGGKISLTSQENEGTEVKIEFEI